MGAFVCILKCPDHSYYVGSAMPTTCRSALQSIKRVDTPATSERRPVELAWSEHFDCINDVVAAERKIKGWSSAKKEALILGNWERVRWLAKRPGARGRNRQTKPSS
jgi:putative endonuclease